MSYQPQPCPVCGLSSCMHPRVELELLVDMASGPDRHVERIIMLPDVRPITKIWKFGRGCLIKGPDTVGFFQHAEVWVENQRIEIAIGELRVTQPEFVKWLHEQFYPPLPTPEHFTLEIYEDRKRPMRSFQLERSLISFFEDLTQVREATLIRKLVLTANAIAAPPGFVP